MAANITKHSKLDVAIIKFHSFDKLLCEQFPVFPKDTSGLVPGLSLCRLGYPFAEFTNYTYNKGTDSIEWTTTGKSTTPRFPIDGMVTRRLLDDSGAVTGFEISTPGLRGQSGGPAFDVEGRIWGMQSKTGHLDMDFDVDLQVMRAGVPKRIQESTVLHVGHCIHVDVLKAFMKENNVGFDEA